LIRENRKRDTATARGETGARWYLVLYSLPSEQSALTPVSKLVGERRQGCGTCSAELLLLSSRRPQAQCREAKGWNKEDGRWMWRLHRYTHRSVLVQSLFSLFGPSFPSSHILFLPSQDEQSGPFLSRLVTRTKEYNMWARVRAIQNSYSQWKQKMRVEGELSLAHSEAPVAVCCLGVICSLYVVTRKMVNYTCVGWSQGKLWWRSEPILTCKSFVKYEYRGERLIELSSSWFMLKFLSG